MRHLKNTWDMAGMAVSALALAVFGGAGPAVAQDRDNVSYVSLSAGVYDFYRHTGRKRDRQGEYRIEYRGQEYWGPVKPYAGLAFTLCPGVINSCPGESTSGSIFVGGGGMIDFKVSDNVFFTPSLGLALYGGGSTDLDLDHFLIGRVQGEFGYRFQDNSRLSLALSHYDNMGLGETNPGTETLSVYLSIPLD